MKLGRSFTGIRGYCFGWLSASKKRRPTRSRAQKSLNITRQSFNDWLGLLGWSWSWFDWSLLHPVLRTFTYKPGRSFTGIRGYCFGWLSASKKRRPTRSRAQKSLNITRQSFNDWLRFGQHGCCCCWLLRSSSFLIASIVRPWFLVELIHHTCMIIVRCCVLCASSVHRASCFGKKLDIAQRQLWNFVENVTEF